MQEFRCYYDDGTVTVAETCPLFNQNNSPLIRSELHIIEDVLDSVSFPWLLIVLGLIAVMSKNR